MKSLRQILVITLGLLCIISCEKDVEHPVETFNTTNEKLITQFFDVGFLETNNPNVHSTTGINTRSTDPLITEIMADMQLAEYETAYINELIDHLGFPAWNHAEVVPHDGNEEIAVLPFAHVEGSSISGVLLATRKENGMKYRLIDKGAMLQIGRQYSDHSFYLASLLYLAHMDKVVFDEVECQLAAMLNAASSNLVEEGIITVRSCYTVTVFWERCVRWLIHVASEDDPEGGYFYEDETCTTYPVTITVCESDAQDILGTATPGDDYFVPPPHTDPPVNNDPNGTNPEPNNNILKKLLDLTDEEADCFNTLAPEVRESLLIDVMSNNIIDPCNPSLTTADIISEAIKVACRGTSTTLDEEGFYEALGNYINDITVSTLYDDINAFDCDEIPCWNDVLGQNMIDAVTFEEWCDHYSGFSFWDLNEQGWFNFLEPGGPDPDFRYIIDPTNNNYVIDMRHLLFVGYYLEQLTGVGNAAGDILEFAQLFDDPNSALNWQDFFSNRLGTAFHDYVDKILGGLSNHDLNFADALCSFLSDPATLYLRPNPNCQ